jgi:outer membrane receptor protein involved in Fe transport
VCKKIVLVAFAATILFRACLSYAGDDVQLLQQQLDELKKNYEQRIDLLEQKLQQIGNNDTALPVAAEPFAATVSNSFNPAISLILDGRFASFDNSADSYELPGYSLGGEAGLGEEGFSLGHTELAISGNVDDKFFGKVTLAVDEHDGETELELEEAYLQTLGLGHGVTLKFGRFFSAIGYLNEQHEHAQDFADAPLIYRGLFGDKLVDDGLQVSYIAPTDVYLEFGAEALRGSRFPGGGEQEGIGAWSAFANIGGDIGIEHSWLLGLSHWQSGDVDGRESGGHSHGGDAETPSFTGDSTINGLDFVYKWAPNGNPTERNFKFQFEYFDRQDNGDVTLLNSGPPIENTSLNGDQHGWYAQAVYQFMPQWRAGLRYDWLDSDNRGSDADILAEAGLDNEGLRPRRQSMMLEWLPSEFSRVRLQFNRDKSFEESDNQVVLQYTHSLGSHGAHQY